MNKKNLCKFLQFLLLLCLTTNFEINAAYDSLGANVKDNITEFRLWSPDSSDVSVFIGESKNDNFTEHKMQKIPEFKDKYGNHYSDVYSYTVNENLHLTPYYFTVNGVKVFDPYARMVQGQNDSSTNKHPKDMPPYCIEYTPYSPGIVIDLQEFIGKTIPANKNDDLSNSVIYEANIADFTSNANSGVPKNLRGTFSGVTQPETTLPGSLNIKTSLDHLVELGITHIQIMPMFEFSYSGHEYNWGYSPVNYFCPQQKYSQYDYNEYEKRIEEVQEMVSTLHKNGIRTVMDVVFNHTYGPIFKSITDKYYLPVDITACGNTVDHSHPMVSNMVRDCLEYWVVVYNIDGFRFDLLGATPYSVAKEWNEFLQTNYKNRKLLCYGEPWAADNNYKSDEMVRPGSTACTEFISNEKILETGFGAFNPSFRTILKGNDNDSYSGGFLFNEPQSKEKNNWKWTMQTVMQGSMGAIRYAHSNDKIPEPLPPWDPMFANMPMEDISYLTCHDGLCYWDKINKWGQGKDKNYLKRIDNFGIAILLTSQGIPFFQCGDEFLRTRKEQHNPYEGPLKNNVNLIDWSLKKENYNTFEFYKNLISLRKNHPAFHMNTWEKIHSNIECKSIYNSSLPEGLLISTIDSSNIPNENWKKIILLYFSGMSYDYKIPAPPNGYKWKIGMEKGEPFKDSGKTVKEGDIFTIEGTALTMLYAEKI